MTNTIYFTNSDEKYINKARFTGKCNDDVE